VNVSLVVNELGLGGTEKGLIAHAARFDRSRFLPRIVCVQRLGPRAGELEAAGVAVECAEGDRGRLAELLRGADLVHAWRASPADRTIPRAARDAGVRALVETSIFGLVDSPSSDESLDCRLFFSKSCSLRYQRRTGADLAVFFRANRVLPLPLDAARLRSVAPERREAKRGLGLDPERPVVGRIGRPDDLKWRDLLIDMAPTLIALVPEVQLLLVGATPAKRRRLRRRGVADHCQLKEPVADERALARMYAACDVFVSAAEIGESQGLALAEAMALEVPVVTCSTPWVDNAQLEYVEHDRTGYVANHPRPFAEAVAALLRHPERRRRFGATGRAQIEAALDPTVLTRRLEGLYRAVIAGEPPPGYWTPGLEELAAFEAGYAARSKAEFRPLTRRERVEARVARERERLRRIRGLLRPRMLPLAVVMVRGRLAQVRRAIGEGTGRQ
jgi:glycosyltransferase involved in cell wall biosynthesis